MKLTIERPECWKKSKVLIDPTTGKTAYPMQVNGKTAYEVDDLYGEHLLAIDNNGLFGVMQEKAVAKPKEPAPSATVDVKKLRTEFREKLGYPSGRMSVEKMMEKMNDSAT